MPRVYDKLGRELTVGARVESTLAFERRDGLGTVRDFSSYPRGAKPLVFVRMDRGGAVPFAVDLDDELEGYRVGCLLLIDSPTEGKEG